MSYILDALRKADAQRERSRAPGLHAQPALRADAGARLAWGRSPLLWGAIGVGVLSVVLVAWQMAQPAPVAPPAPERAVVAGGPGESAPAEAEPAAATAVVPPPPEPRPVPPRAAPATPAAVPTTARASAAAPAAAARASAPVAVAEVGPPPAGAPRLAISGGVYSQNPAQRMLIVGGQVFNEGSEIAPGVRLDEVRPHQAVLSWRGQRYAVGF